MWGGADRNTKIPGLGSEGAEVIPHRSAHKRGPRIYRVYEMLYFYLIGYHVSLFDFGSWFSIVESLSQRVVRVYYGAHIY